MRNISSYNGSIARNFRENPIHDSEHVPEMHGIAVQEIEARVPNMIQREVSKQINVAVRSMIGALRYDIDTSIEIGFRDLGELYKDKRVRQFVSDTICKAIEKGLASIKIDF